MILLLCTGSDNSSLVSYSPPSSTVLNRYSISQDHIWNELGHLAINAKDFLKWLCSQSHDFAKQSHLLCGEGGEKGRGTGFCEAEPKNIMLVILQLECVTKSVQWQSHWCLICAIYCCMKYIMKYIRYSCNLCKNILLLQSQIRHLGA